MTVNGSGRVSLHPGPQPGRELSIFPTESSDACKLNDNREGSREGRVLKYFELTD